MTSLDLGLARIRTAAGRAWSFWDSLGAWLKGKMPAGLYGRALLYQGENQHQQAIVDFTAANGLSPQKVEPLLGRATSYLALDKAKEAAADLDEAVQADPGSAMAWSARGQAYERLGDKAKAAKSYNRALNIRPKDEPARSGLARVGGKAG